MLLFLSSAVGAGVTRTRTALKNRWNSSLLLQLGDNHLDELLDLVDKVELIKALTSFVLKLKCLLHF